MGSIILICLALWPCYSWRNKRCYLNYILLIQQTNTFQFNFSRWNN